MNINWKEVSKSEGYKSLKASYILYVQKENHRVLRKGFHSFRDKEECREYFKKAISLALKYSYKWEIPLSELLTYWESKRDFCWLNFYQESYVSRLKPSL